MNSFLKRFTAFALLFVAVFVLSSCATPPKEEMVGEAAMMEEAAAPTSATPAADLRVALRALLQEHMYLAAAATGAALGGDTAEFEAAAAALDANSVEIAKANGSMYGPEAEAAFLPLWRKHIGFVVDYTTGVATGDTAKQEKAVSDLVAYTQEFGAFLNSATPSLPAETVADLFKTHILQLKEVIDAQAAGDWATAYTKLREGANHAGMIADAHAEALVQQFPEKFAMK